MEDSLANGDLPLDSSELPSSLSQRASTRQQEMRSQIEAQRLYSQSLEHGIPRNTPHEFVIPVRLTAIQRSIYRALLLEHAQAIEKFVENTSETDEHTAESIRRLLESLNAATLHPLIDADYPTDTQMSDSDEAWYIVQSSSKFELLVEIIEALRHQSVRIVVLYDNAELCRLLKIVCRGLRIHYSQTDVDASEISTQDNSVGELEIILHGQNEYVSESPVDLCIAMNNEGQFSQSSVIRLIACNTAEHIQRQQSEEITIVSMIAALHESIGVCTTDPTEIAQQVVAFLCSGTFNTEVLPEITFGASQYDEVSLVNGTSPHKSEPHPEIIITEIDGFEVHTEAPAFTEPIFEGQFIAPGQLQHTPLYEHKEIFSSGEVNKLEADIDRITTAHELLRDEYRSISQEKESLTARLETLLARLEKATIEISTLKSERSTLRTTIEDLRQPEVMSDGIALLNARNDLEKANSRIKSKMEDFEFLRTQYHASSTAAAQLSSENEELRDQITKLEKRVEGVGYKSLIAGLQQSRQEALDEVMRLEARNTILVDQVKRMKEVHTTRGRREVTQTDRKRASSAQEVSSRKKERLGVSPLVRLSVASLLDPSL